MPPQLRRCLAAPGAIDGMAEILGDSEADDRPFRQRGPRAAKSGAELGDIVLA